MSAAVSRLHVAPPPSSPPRPVRRPAPKRLPITISVAQLARLCGVTRQKMGRLLEADGVVRRPAGKGEKRRHYFVTRSDLTAAAPWIVDEIQSWAETVARARRPVMTEDDDGDAD